MMKLESWAEFEATKRLIDDVERNLAELDLKTTLSPAHREDCRRSYERLVGQFRAQLELFEAEHPLAASH